MAGCKRCALKRRIAEGKKEKRKGKGRKNGDQNLFLYKFSYAQWLFSESIKKSF